MGGGEILRYSGNVAGQSVDFVRKPTKRPCKPRGMRVENFWRLGILPCGATSNKLSGEA